MDFKPIQNVTTAAYSSPSGSEKIERQKNIVPVESFQSVASAPPEGIIDPKQLADLKAAASVTLGDDKPGVSVTWDIYLGKREPTNVTDPDYRDDGIYLSRDGFTRKYDYDGKMLWEAPTTGTFRSRTSFDREGNIYVAGEGELVSLDPGGKERWRKPIGKPQYATLTPLISGDRVYLIDNNQEITGRSANGDILWSAGLPRQDNELFLDDTGKLHFKGADSPNSISYRAHTVIDVHQAEQDGTPKTKDVAMYYFAQDTLVGNDGTVYGYQDGKFRALDSDGKEKWSFEIPGIDDRVRVSSKFGPDGNLYVNVPNKAFVCLKPNGEERWRYDKDMDKEPLSKTMAWAKDGTVYVSGGDQKTRLYAIKPDGTVKWRHEDNHMIEMIKVGPDGTIYFGGLKHPLKALSPEDGFKKFEYGSDKTPDSILKFQPTADNNLILTTADGRMKCIRFVTPEQYVENMVEKAAKAAEQAKDEAPVFERREDTVDIDGISLKKKKKGILADVLQSYK